MAWIKIEHETPDKPEVCMIAETLKMDPDCVTGKLFRLWAWADRNSVDGTSVAVTEGFLDRIVHKKGFAAAMRVAGWLRGENGALVFPGFSRHNGETAKARAESNRRVASHRQRNGKSVTNVTPDALQKPLPDKSKSKKETSSLTPLPPVGGDGAIETDVSKKEGREDVQGIVALYPKREGVMAACMAVRNHLERGTEAEAIASGTRAIAAVITQLPGAHLNKYVPSAEKFFRERRWEDDPQTWLRSGGGNGGGPVKPLELNGRGRSGTVIKISAKPTP